MNLRQWCKENDASCLTCSNSYKKYRSKLVCILHCSISERSISEEFVCLNWTND